MEYTVENKAFRETVLTGTMEYFSNWRLLKRMSNEHGEALDVLMKTNIINPRQRGVFVLTDGFGESQIFDTDIMMHIQCMAKQYHHYGAELLRCVGNNLLDDEKNNRQDGFSTIYRNKQVFKDTIQVAKHKWFNIVYKLVEGEQPDMEIIYDSDSCEDIMVPKEKDENNAQQSKKILIPQVELYYSGQPIFSPSLKAKVTYDLASFIDFLKFHTETLHMYSYAWNIMATRKPVTDGNYRFGTWNSCPDSLYDQFDEENEISYV